MSPQTIGRYSILRELGHGAMGVVYEAEDPNIGRRIALKVVRTDQIGANRDEVLRRFKNEAKAAGNLSHPNIITIHDAGEHEGLLYIAMEFVEGTNLAELIAKQGRLPAAKVVDITRQVCAGLDFAHTRGIIHRDVKPANIMLTDALVKITDFGIANVGDGMTITGTVVGTPNYMSPEQVLGKPLDGRSDLFSVGVMLYEMITGERPFEGQSITTIMYKIVHEEPIAPRKLDSTIHPGLSAIVEKALAKAPEMRFQTGAELAAALESYKQLGSGPVTLTGNEPTAAMPALPETAPLTQPNFRTDSVTVRTQTDQTVARPATTVDIAPAKKRGFSPFLLGCFGLMGLGIVAITILTIVAIVAKRDKPPKHAPSTAQQPADSDQQSAPEPAAPGTSAATKTNPAAAAVSGTVVEKAPPKPAQKKATLKLNSNPPGAQIIVDGKPAGKSTPDSVTVDRGEHSIALHMGGFQDATAKFKVSGGEEFEFAPELSPVIPGMNIPNVLVPDVGRMMGPDMANLARLKNAPGVSEAQRAELQMWEKWGEAQKAGAPNILVNSHPGGATIFIDGKDSGKKTPEIVPSSAGQHTVRLELQGYEPFERQVVVGGTNHGPAMVNSRLKPLAPKPPASPERP